MLVIKYVEESFKPVTFFQKGLLLENHILDF